MTTFDTLIDVISELDLSEHDKATLGGAMLSYKLRNERTIKRLKQRTAFRQIWDALEAACEVDVE